MPVGSPIADLGDQPAVRTNHVRNADGEMVVERAPAGRFIKMVKPSGAVVRVPIHNGRASKLHPDNDAYTAWIKNVLMRTGSVPYDRCPQTLPYELTHANLNVKWYRGIYPVIPEHLRDKNPCRQGVNGGPINRSNPCACIEELIKYRKGKQSERMEKAEVKTQAMLQSEASKGLAAAVQGVAEVVRDLKADIKRQPPKPTSIDDEDVPPIEVEAEDE